MTVQELREVIQFLPAESKVVCEGCLMCGSCHPAIMIYENKDGKIYIRVDGREHEH